MFITRKMRLRSWLLFRALAILLAFTVGPMGVAATPLPQSQSGTVQHMVTGQVLDENGEPIIGATVSVKGTNVNAVTDFDGRFSIKASHGATLTVSYVGYGTRDLLVDSSDMTINLQQDAQMLNEVVV